MNTSGVKSGLFGVLVFGAMLTGCADAEDGAELESGERAIQSSLQALTAGGFTMTDAYYGSSYMGCSSSSKKDIVGAEPTEPGTYPVFVYLTGTTMPFSGPEAQLVTSEMAKRGFVAASVEYANDSYPTCSTMRTRASCVFDQSSANSAITKLCSRPKADCSQGVVVSGFSQGANLAALSKNYDSRVRGAYLVGHGNKASGIIDVSSCANDSATALLPSEMRSVNGETDQYFGKALSGVRAQLQAVSGVSCPTSTSCLQPNGSGWIIVPGSAVADQAADHCYFFKGANSSCSSHSGLDTGWVTGTAAWSTSSSLSWLAARVGH